MSDPFRVLIAGGGTGGHVFPGVAVADALARRTRDLAVTWVGTRRGIEARVLPTTPWRFEPIDVSPLNGVRGVALVRSLAKLGPASAHCVRVLRRDRPQVVLGVGGYAGGPVVALAAAMGIPTAVLEPNAVPGLANRILARMVKRAFLTHEEAMGAFPKGVAMVTGSPVRRAFLQRMSTDAPEREVPELLVVGGSQGARAINDVVPEAVALLRARGVRVTVTHQTGQATRDAVAAEYEKRGVEASVVAFIDDVASAMERASLLVCRAGAMTVAELGVIGRPAVYVPLPTAADDHQRKNAEAMTAKGAARWIAQRDLTASRLADELAALLGDPAALAEMGRRAWETARPDAAGTIADELMALTREG
ncbi:MAG: undecaprenyldiphospho-muramoylpentapeptide beta-N-acetylglucosaminyltransferase [Polyangiales bacterium]